MRQVWDAESDCVELFLRFMETIIEDLDAVAEGSHLLYQRISGYLFAF